MKRWMWTALLIGCLGASFLLQRRIDAQRGAATVIEDSLYVSSSKTLRRMSLGYHGLLADIYWLRTIQYFGGKMQQVKGRIDINDISSWRLELLEPLLKLTTELDPNYVAAYRFGGIFLPDLNPESAVRLMQRGIENNPLDWRLYGDLGYIYWKQQRFQEASDAYGQGGAIKGAPDWLKSMQAVMQLKGGDRETARSLFRQMYQSSEDAFTRQLSLTRLKSLQGEDEIALLNRLLTGYRERTGACPPSLRMLVRALAPSLLDQMKRGGMQFEENQMPLDPDGFLYHYDQTNCTSALSDKTTIVRWKDFAK